MGTISRVILTNPSAAAQQAAFALEQDGRIGVPGCSGPFEMEVQIGRKPIVIMLTENGREAARREPAGIRRMVREYAEFVGIYNDAAAGGLPAAKIEAAEKARRDLHAKHAEWLREQMRPVLIDETGSRQLFTLIYEVLK